MQQSIEPYDHSPQEEEPFPILDYLQLLWFRRRLIIVITILVAAIGYVQVNQMRNVYTATSSVLIGVQQGAVTDKDGRSAATGEHGGDACGHGERRAGQTDDRAEQRARSPRAFEQRREQHERCEVPGEPAREVDGREHDDNGHDADDGDDRCREASRQVENVQPRDGEDLVQESHD